MNRSTRKTLTKMCKAGMKKGRQLLHRSPPVALEQDTAEQKRFKKGQKDLDDSLRAVHEAISQKDMERAERLAIKAKKNFDRLFRAHRKAAS